MFPGTAGMTMVVYLALYCGLLIFVVGCIRRIVHYARAPLHLRWELYPVPHEEPGRAAHGGSYFEQGDWWTKPRRFHLRGELGAMVPEMLFLKALWDFNRPLWYFSFLFHVGLYLAISGAVLAVVHAGLGLVSPAAVAGSFGFVLTQVYRGAGISGTVMVIVGAAALFHRRKTCAELRNYTTPADLFNLLLFMATFTLLGVGYLLRPPGVVVSALIRGALTFDTHVAVGAVFGAGLMMAAATAAYIPFTHMAHFIAKFFTYHAVRWDDRANVRNGAMEATLAGYLKYRPSWAAQHVGADGKKTWTEIVAANPAQEGRK